MRASISASLFMVLGTTTASAQPSLTPTLPDDISTQPALEAPKSKLAATLLAVAGTAVPIALYSTQLDDDGGSRGGAALVLGSAMLLPSAGHWYAGKVMTRGLALRIGGGVLVGASLALFDGGEGDGPALLVTAGLMGIGTMAAGAIYDIATAHAAVEAWNVKHATLRPTVVRTGDGYGVGFAGRF